MGLLAENSKNRYWYGHIGRWENIVREKPWR